MSEEDKLLQYLNENEVIEGLENVNIQVETPTSRWYFDELHHDSHTAKTQQLATGDIASKKEHAVFAISRILIDIICILCTVIALRHYNDPDMILRIHSRFMIAVAVARSLEVTLVRRASWHTTPTSNEKVYDHRSMGLPTVVSILVILNNANVVLTTAVIIFWLVTDGRLVGDALLQSAKDKLKRSNWL